MNTCLAKISILIRHYTFTIRISQVGNASCRIFVIIVIRLLSIFFPACCNYISGDSLQVQTCFFSVFISCIEYSTITVIIIGRLSILRFTYPAARPIIQIRLFYFLISILCNGTFLQPSCRVINILLLLLFNRICFFYLVTVCIIGIYFG